MMGMDSKRENRSGCLASTIIGLMLLPVLYVLSIGPVAWLVGNDLMSKWWLDVPYSPLEVIADSWPPFARFLIWYAELWLR